jgi:hypothetical protein
MSREFLAARLAFDRMVRCKLYDAQSTRDQTCTFNKWAIESANTAGNCDHVALGSRHVPAAITA